MKLTADERKHYDELATQLDPIPKWLLPRLEQYAIAKRQWALVVTRLRKTRANNTERYKLGQLSAMFVKQFSEAQEKIERVIEQQAAERAKMEPKARHDEYWSKTA